MPQWIHSSQSLHLQGPWIPSLPCPAAPMGRYDFVSRRLRPSFDAILNPGMIFWKCRRRQGIWRKVWKRWCSCIWARCWPRGPFEMSVARDCKNVKRRGAVSRRSGVDGEYMVEKEWLTSRAGSFRHTIWYRSRRIYEIGRHSERGQRQRPWWGFKLHVTERLRWRLTLTWLHPRKRGWHLACFPEIASIARPLVEVRRR